MNSGLSDPAPAPRMETESAEDLPWLARASELRARPVNDKAPSPLTRALNSLYKTVSEDWRTTLGVARWVCDRHALLTGTGGNRIFGAASGVQILKTCPTASEVCL